jgi:hypothetical protein
MSHISSPEFSTVLHKEMQAKILLRIREDGNGCWLWHQSNTAGYGSIFSPRHKRVVSAHRASYECFVGEIPEGFIVHHTCEVAACVNPHHLRAVSAKQHQALHRSPQFPQAL